MADIETITIIRPPGRGKFGDPAAGTAVEFQVPGCQFAPGPSVEGGVGTNQVDADATVYAPPNIDVLPTDRVRARGEVWIVDGKPQFWGSFGTVIQLRRVTG